MTSRQRILLIFCLITIKLQAQDSTSLQQIPIKYIEQVSAKAASLEEKMDKKSEKAILQLQKEEEKIIKKLAKVDSVAAKVLLANMEAKYKGIRQKIQSSSLKQYIPKLDSLSTSLKFLDQNSQFLSQAKDVKEKVSDAMKKVKGLESQFQKAEEIKKFLKERKQFLKEQISKFGFVKEFKKINKKVYYYSQQVNEYKEILKDPKKIEKKALELLAKNKWFQSFMKKNSMLASLFRMPGDPNDPAYIASLAGLQTRIQVNGAIQQQIQSGGPNAQQVFRQNMQAAQAELNQLKNKVMKFGGGSSDAIMPEGFRPNSQKTKSFLKRLEYGANIQSQKATNFFPVTSDIGLSVGFKPNDVSAIGIGASYKLGWGRGWNHIKLSSEGLGIRSYIEWKIKGSFWISGGYEQNYKTAFTEFSQLKNKNAWQQSGLIGLSKSIPAKTKFFKKTKLMLLWDFLSYRQVPRTDPIVFRIGYNIK